MKKFYKNASLIEKDNHFFVGLDGRTVKTPLANPVALTSKALIERLVGEWDIQGEDIIPQSMPLMQIVTTHIDKTIGQRETIYPVILPYVHGDTVLYFNGDEQELYDEQEEKWLPLIQRVERDMGVSYAIQKELFVQDQNEETLEKWKGVLENFSDEELTFFQIAVSLTASPILTWLLLKDEITVDDVVNSTLLEEIFQSRKWGRDPEGERKEQEIRKELYHLKEYISLV